MTTKVKQIRKNVAGFYRGGQFFPIRKPKFVKTGKKTITGGKQLQLFREKYDGERAGDNDDIFDREIRKSRNESKALENYHKQLENEIRREMFGDNSEYSAGQTLLQFVRAQGGIKRSKSYRGNLEFLTFKESKKRGLVSDTKGKTPDYMFQAANESGFDVSDIDDLLNKLDDEIRTGKATYQTGGGYDYRRNPKVMRTTNAKKPTNAQISQAAKVLANLFPNQSAKTVLQKLKKNPESLDAFDFDFDGDVDAADVSAISENLDSNLLVLTEAGELAQVLAATSDEVVLQILDGANAGVIETAQPDEISLLEAETPAERLENPARIVKINNNYQVLLPNKQFLKTFGGKVWQSKNLSRAREMAAKIKVPKNSELNWLKSLRQRQTNPMHPLSVFANGAVGILSALQIGDRYKAKPRKKTTTPIKPAAKNPKAKAAAKVQINPAAKPSTNPAAASRKIALSKTELKNWLTGKPEGKEVWKNSDAHRLARKYKTEFSFKQSPNNQEKVFVFLKKKTTRKNPQTFKRPAFEMFQGRPATSWKMMPKSKHAPKVLDTIGKLIEIKLHGQAPINFEHRTRNPFVLAMNPKATRLWIAGGKFGRKNPSLEEKQIEVVAPLEYVVYETFKPHIEGDEVERHYIHALGEETGDLPEFALDNEGYPIIHGGAYSIESRGIVN